MYISQHMNTFPVPILGRSVFPQGLVTLRNSTSPRLFQREITGHGTCGFHRFSNGDLPSGNLLHSHGIDGPVENRWFTY